MNGEFILKQALFKIHGDNKKSYAKELNKLFF